MAKHAFTSQRRCCCRLERNAAERNPPAVEHPAGGHAQWRIFHHPDNNAALGALHTASGESEI
jgi:hypothetical protein